MKFIRVYPDGSIEVEAEDVLESLYEVGEYIEYEYQDWRIVEKNGKRYILR